MPAHRKPPELRLLTGARQRPATPSPAAAPSAAVTTLPKAPAWLPNPLAVAAWNSRCAALIEAGTLTQPALGALAQLCALEGTIQELWATGPAPKSAVLSVYRLLLADFGLTPVSAARVPRVTPKAGNPFSGLGKRDR